MSIAGGVDRAPLRAQALGINAVQIFVKSSNQWKAKPLSDAEVESFKKNVRASGIDVIFGHDSYLINLAAPDPASREKSVDAFQIEMERCETLGLPYLVMHPGSHTGSGEDAGIRHIIESFDILHSATKGFKLKVLIETTAGQGDTVGYRFEHIARIIDGVRQKGRLGVCFDTCHVYAAGYDIKTEEGYEKVMTEFDEIIGFDKLHAFHLNDSKKGCGSRVDRHEHLGKGELGLTVFKCLMNDKCFDKIPMVLETPKSEDMHEDVENLKILRKLITKS
jgi:deoxyribonuclease-4